MDTRVPWIPIPFAKNEADGNGGEWDIDRAAVAGLWPKFNELLDGEGENQHNLVRKVELAAGEMLYLPSLWYHAASQKEVTIALNMWKDMEFDPSWVWYQHGRASAGLGSG